MCGRDDDCYLTRGDVKYLFICFGVVAVVVLLAVLLAAFVYLRHVTITVEDASLTRFSLLTSPVTGIAYNLSLTLKVRNPNWAMSMKNVEPFVAAYRFDSQQFDRVQVAATGDKHPAGATRVYHLTSSSQGAFVSLGSAGEQEYRRESKAGTFRRGGGAVPEGELHRALHQVQDRGRLPAQAAARQARLHHRRLPEGEVQAPEGGEELLAS
uniref:Predicted protein n=1 Tax=Hordeum vulgare subsp. vulgare TaxID=112509 RepID=F2EDB1_HORVV|nr:predicted protein [Hordeum vulgare subsp. vulgare]